MNGRDVSLKLLVNSKDRVARTLSFHIDVQAMRYNGTSAADIQSEVKEDTLQPGKGKHIYSSSLLMSVHIFNHQWT